MNIHEYQAAEILKGYGIPINQGIVATTPDEVAAAAGQLGGTVVVKAQVHTGGRGKAGGVKLAHSPEEAREVGSRILGMDIRGHTVHKVLVAPGVDIAREYYLGVVIDRAARGITIMASSAGGVDIEEVARETPEKIHREAANPFLGFHDYQARRLAFKLGIEPDLVGGFARIARQLFEAFVQSDASLAEINPLVLTADRTWLALDSKITIDDSALVRHPDLEQLRDLQEENATELEARAAGISFVKLDGNIGCVVNGAGLSMATMDAIKHYGGEPANFLDVGGGASAEQVEKALRLVLADSNVRAVLINIFGGITRCDEVARGLLAAMDAVKPTVPFVIRLVGTNQDEGRRILADAGITVVDTMPEAAERVVAAASGAA
ncbi:ADP-forming succinate--CoA ligase subunit beta [Sphaerobacter thermophilus]|uniref:Succinate--CoA ligase [ADP-forming] subunit beta n=1 Tax=Sphaerobacter thermophilus (strain ATCC 49802 / DSM 20745 / KCCM 41009 / NCIMB 13125 / S 6022) TaxID=479434 RepID=D1C4Q0_SPHTD|nr:ADP-forming succinate--CoA ligase subunit beta [Sphaerobacter thermophilus]ACZ39217.1 succinyl-CoA synthetase, beta subunit [Sphaerobacter thermophilus DSM 20745]